MVDETEVEIVVGGTTDPTTAATTPAETANVTAAVGSEDEAIGALKRQYDELRARDAERITAAERTAAQASAQAQQALGAADEAKKETVASGLQAVTSKLDAATAATDAAERDYESALEAGDFKRATKAQRSMAEAAAQKALLERDKQTLETQAPATEGRVETIQQQPAAPADPFESAIQHLNPRTQSWLRAHPEFVTDVEQRMRAGAADAAARKKGLSPATDDYFDFADDYLGLKQNQAQSAQQQRRTMPAAPPSRDPGSSPANGATNGVSTKVKLTPGEVERATDGTIPWNTGPNKGKPIGTTEMARRKYMLQQEGAYTRRLPS